MCKNITNYYLCNITIELFNMNQATICAIATPPGNGAIAIIRLSGEEAISIADRIFTGKNKLNTKQTHSLSFGQIRHKEELIDEVLISLFRSPQSYTGEDMIEISCHASPYIQQCIIELLLAEGATLATPGEFTQRAYLNGKLDLSQAEAVVDIINAQSAAAHKVAIQQMRGGYSELLKLLRAELLTFASLIELELDFSEEDVEFANRTQLLNLAQNLHDSISNLADSFRLGNALKKGIPIAIVGRPNVGKSTLLNAIIGENRAIVSDIAGTTRDAIEDSVIIRGIEYRFIDTAGMRETEDLVETMGIERTWEKIDLAEITLLMLDATETEQENLSIIKKLQEHLKSTNKTLLLLINKTDEVAAQPAQYTSLLPIEQIIPIAAKTQQNLPLLKERLHTHYLNLKQENTHILVSNLRHYELLKKAQSATQRVIDGLNNELPTDFIAQDLREALNHLGSITGEISTDDILDSIFHNFCIGK